MTDEEASEWLADLTDLTGGTDGFTIFMHPDDVRAAFTDEEIREMEEAGYLRRVEEAEVP